MKQIIITLLVFTSLSMLAQRNNDKLLYPVIEGGIHFGGDELATLTFVNGDEQTMRAGQGGLLALGVELVKPKDPRLRVRSTIGVKYNTTAAEDVNISFIRFPFAISSLYNWDNGIRFGAGLSYHFAPKFSGDEILPDYNFNSGLGRRVEVGYKWIMVILENINYSLDGAFEDVGGFSLGLSASYIIGYDYNR